MTLDYVSAWSYPPVGEIPIYQALPTWEQDDYPA